MEAAGGQGSWDPSGIHSSPGHSFSASLLRSCFSEGRKCKHLSGPLKPGPVSLTWGSPAQHLSATPVVVLTLPSWQAPSPPPQVRPASRPLCLNCPTPTPPFTTLCPSPGSPSAFGYSLAYFIFVSLLQNIRSWRAGTPSVSPLLSPHIWEPLAGG